MTKVLRHIGYWDGPAVPEGLPDVCEFVSAEPDVAVQRAVAAYLRSGTTFVVAAGLSVCRLCGAGNGGGEQTDGEYFVWPEGLAHYVEEHGVRLPDEVVAIAVRGPAPDVDPDRFALALLETGELTIDTDWWAGLSGRPAHSGPATVHLLGCRRNASVARWNLPTTADIYIDRVPPNSIAPLAQLRRLLGTAWPFSGLRHVLDTQPFLAVTAGNPAALHRRLATSPRLRPYLFYDDGHRLIPVWSDNTTSPSGTPGSH